MFHSAALSLWNSSVSFHRGGMHSDVLAAKVEIGAPDKRHEVLADKPQARRNQMLEDSPQTHA